MLSYPAMFQRWFRGRGGSGWRTSLLEQYGAPDENPAFWNGLSANSYLTDLSGPIQIHRGTGDTTVPFSFSTMLEAKIRAAGKPVELFLYDGDDHNIAANHDDALTLSVVFFQPARQGG